MAPLPTGTVTFLFTDIEGSTTRWEHERAAMQAALARHDASFRDTIEAHGRYVFKTVGDAVCAMFGRVTEAATSRKVEAYMDMLERLRGFWIRMLCSTTRRERLQRCCQGTA